VEPVFVFNSYIFFVPNSASIAFLRSSASAAAFLGSLGLAAGGAFPPFAFASYASFSSSSAFFLSYASILCKAISYNYFLFFYSSSALLVGANS
jgi:hypothetical protein